MIIEQLYGVFWKNKNIIENILITVDCKNVAIDLLEFVFDFDNFIEDIFFVGLIFLPLCLLNKVLDILSQNNFARILILNYPFQCLSVWLKGQSTVNVFFRLLWYFSILKDTTWATFLLDKQRYN